MRCSFIFPGKACNRTVQRMRTATLVALSLALMAGCATTPRSSSVAEATEAQSLEQEWGIEIQGIRQTAAGHMLDFRYKVTDPERAAELFDRGIKPHLIHHDTGKVLTVPVTAKVGPLRTSNKPQQGRTYWMFFGNGAGLAKAGDRVTVVIGDFRTENLTVQ